MEFIRRLLFSNAPSEKLVLKYDKSYDNWVVVRAGSVVYVGNKEQCQTYMDYQAANRAQAI